MRFTRSALVLLVTVSASAAEQQITIRYDDDRLSAEVTQVPLGDVLRELAKMTGTEVRLADPALARDPLTASIEAEPLESAVRQLLRGYSYDITFAGTQATVTVYSARREDAEGEPRASAPPGVRKGDPPRTLDEFRPISDPPAAVPSVPDGETARGEADRARQNAARREQELQRSLAVLASDQVQLRTAAIEAMVGMDDPRATAALVRAAATGGESAGRAHAVQALWHHAADLRFANPAANEALSRLAMDDDPQIRALGGRAVEDMAQYRQRYGGSP